MIALLMKFRNVTNRSQEDVTHALALALEKLRQK
jgi:hypothetical protein